MPDGSDTERKGPGPVPPVSGTWLTGEMVRDALLRDSSTRSALHTAPEYESDRQVAEIRHHGDDPYPAAHEFQSPEYTDFAQQQRDAFESVTPKQSWWKAEGPKKLQSDPDAILVNQAEEAAYLASLHQAWNGREFSRQIPELLEHEQLCDSEGNRGPWSQTYTGKRFYLLSPSEEDFSLTDIAHSLSMQCRYNGHTAYFYSVAEHSLLLARYVAGLGLPPGDQMEALMHDAAEAYTGDLTRPTKDCIPHFHDVEAAVDAVLRRRFGLQDYRPDWLYDLDQRIVVDEKRHLMAGNLDWPGFAYLEPLHVSIDCLTPEKAELAFLRYYASLKMSMGLLP